MKSLMAILKAMGMRLLTRLKLLMQNFETIKATFPHGLVAFFFAYTMLFGVPEALSAFTTIQSSIWELAWCLAIGLK